MTTSEMKARDRTRLVYRIHGPAEGRRRMVLVHSLGMDRSFWAPAIGRLMGMAGTA
jgi:hypothetical protein